MKAELAHDMTPSGIGPDLAIAIAAELFGMSRNDILCHRRHAPLVRARAFVVWSLRSLGKPVSYPQIGRMLGGRDHSTIINLHEKAIYLRLKDAEFARFCFCLTDRFEHMRSQGNACH